MAAANTDKIRKKKSLFSTTLSSDIASGDTTIPLSSAAGLPTDTAVTLTINRVDANGADTFTASGERVCGVVSGNNLTSCLRAQDGTSAKAHSSGDIVEDIWDADTWNDFCDAFLAEHSQAGAHSLDYVYMTGDELYLAPTGSGKTNIVSGDINLADAANIQEAGVDPYKTIDLLPGFLKETTTAPCAAAATVEAGTNDIDYQVLDFDKTTQEMAFANLQMPDNWDGGVIQFRTVWTAAAGTAAQTFELELAGRALADDDAIDQAVGTFVGIADALIATGDIHISAWSGDVTLAGTPAGGQFVHFEVQRDVANDDLDADARLICVQIRYKEKQYNHY